MRMDHCSLHNFTTTNLPAAVLHSMRKTVNFFFIVHVEEQKKGLDNPSYPPRWCIQAQPTGLITDRHPWSRTAALPLWLDEALGAKRSSTRTPLRRRRPVQAATSIRGPYVNSKNVRAVGQVISRSCHVLTSVTHTHTRTYMYWICAQWSPVRICEFRVDCCGSSIFPRSHQILMMSIFQSTGPRTIGGWEVRFAVTGLSLSEQLYEDAIFHTFFPRSSIREVGDNHGLCLQFPKCMFASIYF